MPYVYLRAGADFALVRLPGNSAQVGVWPLFDFGVDRFNKCVTYGFGKPDSFGRILLLGFDQFDASTSGLLSAATRQRMRAEAAGPGTPP